MRRRLPTLPTLLALLPAVTAVALAPGAAAARAGVPSQPAAHTAGGSEIPSTTIVNGGSFGATIRFDTDGNAIDAHDGEIARFADRYYLYGTSYGCGYVRFARPTTPWCGYRSYSSTDLVHWTDDGPLFNATSR